ncbi:hypothetical protein Bbelb_418780 [Branchiostoma belcheri]|nr:hypothetical protein Bbelb_418780 [Branchiostoma belcheri]
MGLSLSTRKRFQRLVKAVRDSNDLEFFHLLKTKDFISPKSAFLLAELLQETYGDLYSKHAKDFRHLLLSFITYQASPDSAALLMYLRAFCTPASLTVLQTKRDPLFPAIRMCSYSGKSRVDMVCSLILLIEHGVGVSARTRHGQTALHIAALCDVTELVDVLVEAGVPVDARDAQGWTPLLTAAAARHVVFMEFLLANGADINAVTHLGQTPIHLATKTKFCFAERERDPCAYRKSSPERSVSVEVGFLTDSGVDINHADRRGRTALHYAAHEGEYYLVSALLSYGADPDMRTRDAVRATPLYTFLDNRENMFSCMCLLRLLESTAYWRGLYSKQGTLPTMLQIDDQNMHMYHRLFTSLKKELIKETHVPPTLQKLCVYAVRRQVRRSTAPCSPFMVNTVASLPLPLALKREVCLDSRAEDLTLRWMMSCTSVTFGEVLHV